MFNSHMPWFTFGIKINTKESTLTMAQKHARGRVFRIFSLALKTGIS